jgi:hypothetical protein
MTSTAADIIIRRRFDQGIATMSIKAAPTARPAKQMKTTAITACQTNKTSRRKSETTCLLFIMV